MNFAGIDFGTTNSYVALLSSDGSRIAHTRSGERSVPSRLFADGNEFYSIKRYLGRSPQELDHLGLQYIQEGDNLLVQWAGKTYSPEDLAARVFTSILQETETELPLRAVLAVPAHYDEAQRRATQRAAQLSGIEVERLVHEPTAAALAYGDAKEDERVLVFDLGGGTLDLSLLEVGGGIFEVLQTSGNRNLGGDDLDMLLAVEISKRLNLTFSREVLLEACNVKHELSGCETSKAIFPGHKTPLETEITRQDLEKVAAPFLLEIESTLQEFKDARADRLLLVGGMSRMPAVVSLVENYFDMQSSKGIDPEAAVALGAAKYMQTLRGTDDTLLLDITPMSLGIEVEGDTYSVIIPRGTRIPFSSERMFSTSRDNQSSVEINILQGEETVPAHNRPLGRIWLRGIDPAPAGLPEIWVSFRVDESGMLHAFVSESGHGEEIKIDLANSGRDLDTGL